MKKADLIAKVETKDGFVKIVSDSIAPDSPQDGDEKKRHMTVAALNADGTKYITNVFYIHNEKTDEAWFYNLEPSSLQKEYKSVEEKTVEALNAYCKSTFDAYFLIPERIDSVNRWAVVEAYVLNKTTMQLDKSLKMVYRKGNEPITHIDIIE